jgi:hypothetical protein
MQANGAAWWKRLVHLGLRAPRRTRRFHSPVLNNDLKFVKPMKIPQPQASSQRKSGDQVKSRQDKAKRKEKKRKEKKRKEKKRKEKKRKEKKS